MKPALAGLYASNATERWFGWALLAVSVMWLVAGVLVERHIAMKRLRRPLTTRPRPRIVGHYLLISCPGGCGAMIAPGDGCPFCGANQPVRLGAPR